MSFWLTTSHSPLYLQMITLLPTYPIPKSPSPAVITWVALIKGESAASCTRRTSPFALNLW